MEAKITETVKAQHTNSQGELISIQRRSLRGDPVECLVIHDDPPPLGTSKQAPMLLDAGTRAWLLEQLADRRTLASVKVLSDLTTEAIESIAPADVENLLKNRVLAKRVEELEAERDAWKESGTKEIIAALDARDEAHKHTLESLRERLTADACEWFLLFGMMHDSVKNLEARLRAIPLTVEAQP